MSYNGSGTFNINTAGQPVVTGTTITSTAFNLLTADLANGLTTALTKDGQTTPTANIPMGGFKVTGLGAGTSATDAAQYGQLQTGATTIATVSGTDTITGSLIPAPSAYATGNLFSFVASGTNTGAATINLNSLGAKSITKQGSTALAAGDIVSGQVYLIEYDGTRFQLLNPSGLGVSSISFGSTGLTPSTATGGAVTVAGTLAIANGGTNSSATPTAGGVGYGTGTALAYSAVGTAGQALISNGSSAPTWGTYGSFGADMTAVDYLLTLSSAVGSSARMQSVSLDGISELMIIYGDTSAHAVVFNTSTNTFGTPVLVRTATLTATPTIALAKISSTSVLVCSLPSGDTALETVVLTISGSTVTVNTPLATFLAAGSDLITANTRLVTVGSSYVLNYATSSGGLQKFRAITVSGTTPSIGSELAYSGGTLASQHHSYAYSSSILLAFSMTSATTVYAYPITVSGTTLTGGTQATKTTTGNFICTGVLSTGRVALAWRQAGGGTASLVSVSGSTATITDAAQLLSVSSWSPQIQIFSNQAFVLGGVASGLDQISVLTDTSGTPTVGTPLTITTAGGLNGYLSSGKVFFATTNAGNSAYYQYGISAGAPVLEKTFQNVTNVAAVTTPTTTIYSQPLSGLPQSSSNKNTILRTSAGKSTNGSSTTFPFLVSFDATYPAKLQQSANPFTAFNDGISDAVNWGLPTPTSSTATTIQLRKVTLA